MSVDLGPVAIEARLREASRLAGSLRPEKRLETKLDLRGPAVAARLAWVDVRPVVSHALPALAASTLAIAALELAWLSWIRSHELRPLGRLPDLLQVGQAAAPV